MLGQSAGVVVLADATVLGRLPPPTGAVTPDTVEAFTFDDPATRNAWRNMVAKLVEIGVLDLTSIVVEGTLDLTYNNAITPRESIRTVIESNGFTVEPATTTFPAVGSKILIPPYQTV